MNNIKEKLDLRLRRELGSPIWSLGLSFVSDDAKRLLFRVLSRIETNLEHIGRRIKYDEY